MNKTKKRREAILKMDNQTKFKVIFNSFRKGKRFLKVSPNKLKRFIGFNYFQHASLMFLFVKEKYIEKIEISKHYYGVTQKGISFLEKQGFSFD